MENIDLTQLKEGQTGIVVDIQSGHNLLQRLNSMGIRTGKKVTKISSQFMCGPITLRIDNYQLAIGFGMAKKIMVYLEKKK